MMSEQEQLVLGQRVAAYAEGLGLHGVLILSPRCDKCGECHDFQLTSDLLPEDGAPAESATHKLLEMWCDRTESAADVYVKKDHTHEH